MKKQFFILLLCIHGVFFIFWKQAGAQGTGIKTYTLEPVIVTGDTAISMQAEAVVSPETFERTQSAKTADDFLKDLAGIDIQRTSPTGDKGGSIKIRGFSERRSLILLDGRPLNGSGVYGGHYIDWSALSTEDIERIEVVRGAKYAEFGNTMGGVINIVTKKGSIKPKASAGLSYGSYQTFNFNASHSGSYQNVVSYSVSIGRSQVNSPYLRNNDVTRNNLAGRVSFLLPHDFRIGLRGRYTYHKRGFIMTNQKGNPYYDADYPESYSSAGGGPGIKFKGGEYTWGDGSYWKNFREQYDLELEKTFGSVHVLGQFYLNDQDRTEYFYAITDADKLVLERKAKPEDNTRGWLIKADQYFRGHRLKYGLEGVTLITGGLQEKNVAEEYFKRKPVYDGLEKNENIDRLSAFIQDNWQITGKLGLYLGLRYDSFHGHDTGDEAQKTDLDAVSPKFGAAYTAWNKGSFNLNIARAFRFPTVPEFYWYYAGYRPEGRKKLSPSEAIQIDGGYTQGFANKGSITIRAYNYVVDDYIRWIFGYRPSRVVYNIDKVTMRGIELEGAYNIFGNFALSGNYTYQTSKKKGDILDNSMNLTDKLTELPEHKLNLSGKYHHTNGATGELRLRYVGERKYITGSITKPDAAELETLDSFMTVDIFASYPVFSRGRYLSIIRIGIENILDEDYKEISGYPMPGRTLTLGIDQKF